MLRAEKKSAGKRSIVRGPLGAAALLAVLAPTAAGASTPPTGDQKRSYQYSETGATMPFRLYVPSSYDGTRALPMVVVLHGGGADQDQPVDSSSLREEAEKRSFILVSPLGYDRHGGYGSIYPGLVTREAADRAAEVVRHDTATGKTAPLSENAANRDDVVEFRPTALTDLNMQRRSEQDVLNVMEIVEGEYHVDPARVYIMGNSMGGGGALYFGVKYAEKFAGVAASGATTVTWAYPFERLRENGVGLLYVHGDGDEQTNSHWAQVAANYARKRGVDAAMLLVKGGDHRTAWRMAVGDTLDFLLKRAKP